MDDIIYKISINPWHDMEIKVYEYKVSKETAKSVMAENGAIRFARDEIDKPLIEHYAGWFRGASLVLYETTREEVLEHGVAELRKAVNDWLTEKAEYYTDLKTKLFNQTLIQ